MTVVRTRLSFRALVGVLPLVAVLAIAVPHAAASLAPAAAASAPSNPSRASLSRHMSASADPGRAMWVWDWSDSSAVVSFARAHGVGTIFAYVAPGFTNPSTIPPGWTEPEWPLVTSLVAEAHSAGIAVDAMGGDPSWIPKPGVAVAWADEIVRSGLFDGVHLELEPWQLTDWTSDQSGLIAEMVTAVADIRDRLGALPLDLSLPWWLYQYSTADGTPLDVALLHYADTATIVSFFDTAGQVVSFGAHEQDDAASLGVPYYLAVETDDVQPSWTTFYGSTQAQLAAAMDAIDSANADEPGYLGVAVEDFTGWVAMPTA